MTKKYFIYNSLSKVTLLGAFRVMYLVVTGLSFTKIALLLSIQSLSSLIFSVPMGFLADTFGRKSALFVGNLSKILAYICILLSPNIIAVILMAIFMGINLTVIKTTEESLTHDYTENNGLNYLEVRGRLRKHQVLTNLLFNFLFAYMYSINPVIPITTIITLTSLSLLLLFFIKIPNSVFKRQKIKDIVKKGFPEIYYNKNLSYSFVYGVIFISIITLTIALKAPVLASRGFNGEIVGYIDASLQLISFLAYAYVKQIGQLFNNNIKEISALMLIFGLVLAGIFREIGLIIICITPFINSIAPMDISRRIADYSPNEAKASILSLKELLVSLIFMIFIPVLGFITDKFSVYFSNLFLALLLLVSLLIIKIIYKREVFKNELEPAYSRA